MNPFAGLIEGIALSNVLYGIAISQAYVYMQNCRLDPKWMKLMVIFVMFVETLSLAFTQRLQYVYSGFEGSDPRAEAKIDWGFPCLVLTCIVVDVIVTSFYVYRIWTFSRNLVLTLGTTFLLLAQHALYIKYLAEAWRSDTLLELQAIPGYKSCLIATWCLSISSDTIIAGSMAFHLYHRQAQLKRTRDIMKWLILYFVNTGAALVLIVIASLISLVASPNTLIYGGMVTLYIRALPNSMLGMLNARALLRTKRDEIVTLGGSVIKQDHTLHTAYNLRKVKICIKHDATESSFQGFPGLPHSSSSTQEDTAKNTTHKQDKTTEAIEETLPRTIGL